MTVRFFCVTVTVFYLTIWISKEMHKYRMHEVNMLKLMYDKEFTHEVMQKIAEPVNE